MKLGFLSNGLVGTLEEKMAFARAAGFKAIEVACWPVGAAKGADLDVTNFSPGYWRRLSEELGVEMTALAYYDNMLHPDLTTRAANQAHLLKVIDAAALLDIPLVGTYIGKNPFVSIQENFALFEEIFHKIVHYAKRKNVKIMIENCPMTSWSPDGLPMTISYTPELWEEMFRRIDDTNFGLNFDPSHLVWQQIDYLACIARFSDRIMHVHAKDLQVNRSLVATAGIYGQKLHRADYRNLGWYTPKIPGRGEIDWPAVLSLLKQLDYCGMISVEYGDDLLSGSAEKVKQGMRYVHNYLAPMI
ncbi:sugar phosphate isomerase/epimerase family protein [Listeria costaricensis]|uniref:sugar phosphate isomerase/epimerase family protein n=1 Tax=Listeria costaricensis TaxID=2026604 RepID=UPI000C085114|nr:sugar phosphate isomerase/epimerase family protein [Listeria costaricensis]